MSDQCLGEIRSARVISTRSIDTPPPTTYLKPFTQYPAETNQTGRSLVCNGGEMVIHRAPRISDDRVRVFLLRF